jgi:hypothetical protein
MLVTLGGTKKTWDCLTVWSSAFEKLLIVVQIVKKFPAFHGIQRFIIIFTRAFVGLYPEPY